MHLNFIDPHTNYISLQINDNTLLNLPFKCLSRFDKPSLLISVNKQLPNNPLYHYSNTIPTGSANTNHQYKPCKQELSIIHYFRHLTLSIKRLCRKGQGRFKRLKQKTLRTVRIQLSLVSCTNIKIYMLSYLPELSSKRRSFN